MQKIGIEKYTMLMNLCGLFVAYCKKAGLELPFTARESLCY
jgi:hypothetical protein